MAPAPPPVLRRDFFARSVHEVARDLIGCELRLDGVGGVIVETESYHADDPACHAYGGRTARNESLFGPPGHAYVYLSYGIHNLLNFVCEPAGQAAAVLIRALEPTRGLELMRVRRGRERPEELCAGPGRLAEALSVSLRHDGAALDSPPFELRHPCGDWLRAEILSGPRIGISKAVDYPWRYCAARSACVSRPLPPAMRGVAPA